MLNRVIVYVCLSLVFISDTIGQQQHLFDRVAGLPNVAVIDIAQDETGLMWFATRYGLNSYDGNTVTEHRPPGLDFSISLIDRIVSDGNGHLFLNAHQALLEFDLKKGTFRTLISWDVSAISKGKDCLWICVKNSVFKYDFITKRLLHVAVIENSSPDIAFNCITEDSNGFCWVGSSVGVYRMDTDHKIKFMYPDFYVKDIFEDSAGNLWFCSANKGLMKYSRQGTQTIYRSTEDVRSIISNDLRCIREDEQGRMWIGSRFGLCILDPVTGLSERLPSGELQSLSARSITSIFKDRQGTIWVSTYYGGVNYINPQTQRFRYYRVGKEGQFYPMIEKFAEQDNERIWMGTIGYGRLLSFDPQTSQIDHFPIGRDTLPSIIKEVFYDKERACLWLGYTDNGLDKFDLKTKKVINYNHKIKNLKIVPYGEKFLIGSSQNLLWFDPDRPENDPVPFMDNNEKPSVLSLLCDSRGLVWIGTRRGLMVYNAQNKRLKKYNNSARNNKSISGDIITAIIEDRDGNIWLVSMGGGLNRYVPQSDSFERYTSLTHGLQDNNITAIAVAPSGSILLGTTMGLSILNPANSSVRNYNHRNGFPLKVINEGAIFVSAGGDIYLGGKAGMVVFREDDLLGQGIHPTQIWFSQLFVNGQPVDMSHPDNILTQNLQFSDRIRLKYNYNNFSLRPATDNYVRSGNVSIEYRLKSYNDQWLTMQDQQMLTYTSLPPGTYELEVRVKEYPEVRDSLEIKIIPPIYRAWYAYLVYIVLIGGLFWWLYRNNQTRFYLKTSLEFEKREKESTKKMVQNKLNFFTNISHELNTPLTMIIAQVDTLLQSYSLSAIAKNKIMSIYKNAENLKQLIAEMIEFRRQEKSGPQRTVSRTNLSEFLRNIYSSFSEFAIDNRIDFVYIPFSNTNLELWIDSKNLYKVVSNILSNAFKFTKSGGNVRLEAVENSESVTIIISDTGIGLEKGSEQHIFEQFYQSRDASRYGGFGIGLAFSKNIVDAYNGEIRARNREDGLGAVFEIELPKGDTHTHLFTSVAETDDQWQYENIPVVANEEQDNDKSRMKQARVLIVEDNKELALLLASAFGEASYAVDIAYNAETGIEKVRNRMPDLIISDVMLPRMLGTEFCSVIKNNLETCHIPVILLTARSAERHKIEGLQIGADDYITKPFDMYLLLVKCNNLLNNRKLLQRKYFSEPNATHQVLAVSDMDQEFIDQATQIVMNNLNNNSLSVDVFAREMKMSRTLFFNKMKGITGVTPNKFVLNLKLKKAADMLSNDRDLAISEIAYSLGFNSPNYFAVCFKNLFAYTPTEFREKENS